MTWGVPHLRWAPCSSHFVVVVHLLVLAVFRSGTDLLPCGFTSHNLHGLWFYTVHKIIQMYPKCPLSLGSLIPFANCTSCSVPQELSGRVQRAMWSFGVEFAECSYVIKETPLAAFRVPSALIELHSAEWNGTRMFDSTVITLREYMVYARSARSIRK